ncbi:4-vinyl reductase, partial [Acinetobacter variabilis]
GYTSAFMGRLILFKETHCAACGADHCEIVGKPIDEWPDGDEQRQYFEDESLLDTIAALNEQVQALKTTIESTCEPNVAAGMLV